MLDADTSTFAYVLFTAAQTSQTAEVTAFNSLDPFAATATPYWTFRLARTSTPTANFYTRIRIDTYTGSWFTVSLSNTITNYTFWGIERTSNDWRQAKIDFYVVSSGMLQANAYDLTLNLVVRTPLRRSTDLITRRVIFAPFAFVPTAKSVPVPLLGEVVPPMPIPSRAVLVREEPPEEITW